MFPALAFQDAHLVNERSLSFTIRMFDGAAYFHGMIDPMGEMIYKHLMIRHGAGYNYETVPVF